MSTTLKISTCGEISAENLHFIPAEIQHNGQANVKSYFESTIRKENDTKITASLRGRPLQGKMFDVPSGYTGLLFNETRKPVLEEDDRELTASQSFKSFTYWNLDRSPSEGDSLYQAMTWIKIAKALHSPVDSTPSDSQSSLKSEVSM